MALVGTLDLLTNPDRVSFAFTVENDGDEPVTLSFRDARTADFVVLDGEDERWRWSDEKVFAQMLRSTELVPGDAVTYDGEWSEPEPGTYTAVAILEAEELDCEARAAFSV
ncbi:BsuPI-related putative proteinase inhibitor [Halococcus hamelinensis]|uniref:Intracellular proteinase inhibitor BsuPI domain-containing protein n=1 Tax=Halococcus hamelinensis 100A6 TaxID=1132509 RepID=M0M100_9EURY|nr:BsuPI-related putative proteinase inhibitor [Halococcus hamelinensis]EMA39088.1 hypothetical protein C447_08023 [Halococcus hamelinensis 100A6]